MATARIPAVTIGVLTAVLALAGCSSNDPSAATAGSGDSAIKLAGVYENTQDPAWITQICGAQEEAKRLGVDLKISSIPTADNGKLSSALDTAMLADPDGVIFGATDATAWLPKVKKIMDQGVPVSTNQPDITTQLGWAGANADGGVASEDIKKMINGQTGTALQLLGLAKASWQSQRVDPVQKALQEANPALKWIDPQIDGFDVNNGTKIISSMITAHPDLKVIVAAAGPEGQAAAAAVKQNNMVGKIFVVAFDATPAEVAALRDGSISLLVGQPVKEAGRQQVKIVVDYLKAHPDNKGAVAPDANTVAELKLGVITKANVDAPESQDFQYKASC